MEEYWFEEFRTYLPKYLSPEASNDLFREIEQFPDNIDGRMYTTRLVREAAILQGDGLPNVWVSDLPDPRVKTARVMVLSNSCDTAPKNKRWMGRRLIYCPIIKFAEYERLVKSAGESASEHLAQVRKQRTTTMFYLPGTSILGEDSIALLDRMNNCDMQQLDLNTLITNRLFTLSDYGFYMFLFKLSIHLTRLREGVQRN